MFLQILGLAWVAPSVSGMITAMPVLLAPIAQAGLLRRPVSGKIWVAAGIALAGCLVLTLGPAGLKTSGSLVVTAPFPFAGELATFGSAICFTAHILLIDHYGPRCGATQLTSLMFVVVGLGSLGAALGFGALPLHTTAHFTALMQSPSWVVPMGILILFSSMLAMWLMNRAQPSLSPARAAVLYTLEPVFAVLFSILLGQELLSPKTLVGGALILGAAIYSSRDWNFLSRPKA
jgi:drug/metabolite transporter (DMT)-like permease